jgi:ribosomal protein S18 acetylase RimI-like enzyme
MIEIIPAQSGEALADMITLAQEYVTWMLGEVRTRYPDLDQNEFAAEHTYDDIRKKFPGEHVPPDGCLMIARQNGVTCGCIALGRLSNDICEMRTLFVRPECRGEGAGRKLAEACIEQARQFGYKTIRLDTLAFMEGAQTLYRLMGFYPIEPYLDLSADLKRHIRFFERGL